MDCFNGILKIDDLYMLKLMEVYFNLSYNLLSSYSNCYMEVINDDLPCQYAPRLVSFLQSRVSYIN